MNEPPSLVTSSPVTRVRAVQLCHAAEIIAQAAATVVAESRRQRDERRRWQVVRSACSVSPDHIVVTCAYCERVRDPQGSWGAIPSYVSKALHRRISNVLRLSHTICPDCLVTRVPAIGRKSGPAPAHASGAS